MLDIDWELLLRYCERDCAPADRERFDRWLDGDRRHRAFYTVIALGGDLGPCIDPPPAPAWRAGDRVNRAWGASAPRRLIPLIAAALLAATIPIVFRLGTRAAPPPATPAVRIVTTRPGERAIVRWSDGSQIVVAAASTLHYPTQQPPDSRQVDLTGEAYFDVAHDEHRPFVVHANGATLRDLGTAFDVRAYPSDARVRVVVAEGRVAIGTGGEPAVVDRGHLAQLDQRGGILMRAVDPRRYVAWTAGELVFAATPLGDAAQDLARWYGTPVIVRDRALARRAFTGTFDRESLADVLAIIGRSVSARVEWRADTAILTPQLPN